MAELTSADVARLVQQAKTGARSQAAGRKQPSNRTSRPTLGPTLERMFDNAEQVSRESTTLEDSGVTTTVTIWPATLSAALYAKSKGWRRASVGKGVETDVPIERANIYASTLQRLLPLLPKHEGIQVRCGIASDRPEYRGVYGPFHAP